MATGIITILAALVPFVIWLWKSSAAKKADPINQDTVRKSEYDRQVIKNDEAAANSSLADDLDRLHQQSPPVPGDQR